MDLPAFVGPRGPWLREFSGICLEMYRTKARHAQGPMLEELNVMWQTAHDMCSLSAYHAAFADCKEGEVYDPSEPHSYSDRADELTVNLPSPRLDTVWQLIGLTNWVMDFLERLMKECILFGEQPAGVEGDKVDMDESDDDLFGSAARG